MNDFKFTHTFYHIFFNEHEYFVFIFLNTFFLIIYVEKDNCFGMVSDTEKNSGKDSFLFICLYVDHGAHEKLSRYAYPICLMVSNVFLLITFFIYTCLPELRQPLFGKITMIFLLSLTFAYLMAAIVKFIELVSFNF